MKLDLHGVKHNEVQKKVDSFLYENYDRLPLQIITGYSSKMKDIVIEILVEYGHNYRIGDYLGINTGFIEVY